jgi:hypothetical protein
VARGCEVVVAALGFFVESTPPLVVPAVLAFAWLLVASVILATHTWTTAS